MSKEPITTFMTGATGFLGTYLLRDLLREGRRVLAMVREPLEESRRRLFDGLAALDVDLAPSVEDGRPLLLVGSLHSRINPLPHRPS